ncbi:MAG: FHA domain-containing protein [Planctomycetales bacterium]|nr:FHA domain-containing protein [Planctomycetales bacterium]
MKCMLKIVEGPASGLRCHLRDLDRVSIGRRSDSDICIANDPHMSRSHVVVESVGGALQIRDLGSSNGTFVNNSRVSVVELHVGDKIKIGSSVFQVGNDDESDAPSFVGRRIDSISSEPIPSRTLSGEDLRLQGEVTHPYVPLRDREKLMATRSEWATLGPEISLSAPSGLVSRVDPASQAAPSGQAATLPIALDEYTSAFLGQFQPKERDYMLHQIEIGRQQQNRALDLLEACRLRERLSLIVNSSQLEAAEAKALERQVSFCDVRRISAALLVIESNHHRDVLDFYRRCLGRDAAVCVVTEMPLNDVWLRNTVGSLSFPSMLFDVARQSSQRAAQLMQGVKFLLFEPNTDGELCLLLKPST